MNKKRFKKWFSIVLSIALILPMVGNVGQVRAASKYYAYIYMSTSEDVVTNRYGSGNQSYYSILEVEEEVACSNQSMDAVIEKDGSYSVTIDGLNLLHKWEEEQEIESLSLLTTIPEGKGTISNVSVMIDNSFVDLTSEVTSIDDEDNEYIMVDFTDVAEELYSLPNSVITISFFVSDVQFDASQSENCTLSYNANGAENEPEEQTFTAGKPVVISSAKPVEEGISFLGWSLKQNSTTVDYYPGDKATFTSDVTLFAVWGNPDCTLIYDTQGGNMVVEYQECQPGKQVIISSETPVKYGYIFKGWATDSSAKNVVYKIGDAFTIKNTTTLYAVWEPAGYRIVYNANGAKGKIENETCFYNEEVVLASSGFSKSYSLTLDENYPGGKTKTDNYAVKLLGWMTSARGTVKYKPGAKVKNLAYDNDDAVYLYAKWEQKDITLPTLKRSGYEFMGWSENKDALTADYEPGNKCPLDQNMKLYAVWVQAGFGNSKNVGNGTIIKTQDAKYVVTDKNQKTVYFDKPLNKNVKAVTIPKNIQYQGDTYTVKGMESYAFYDCKQLKSVTVQANVSELPSHAFYNCSNLVKLVFTSNITKIGTMSFKNCKSLGEISPGNVNKIAEDAFIGCEKLLFSGKLNKRMQKYAVKYGFCKLDKPKLVKSQKNGILTVEWKKVKNAKSYEIYRKVGNEGYKLLTVAKADQKSIHIQLNRIRSGNYGIKVRATYKTVDHELVSSSYSNEIKFTK